MRPFPNIFDQCNYRSSNFFVWVVVVNQADYHQSLSGVVDDNYSVRGDSTRSIIMEVLNLLVECALYFPYFQNK